MLFVGWLCMYLGVALMLYIVISSRDYCFKDVVSSIAWSLAWPLWVIGKFFHKISQW